MLRLALATIISATALVAMACASSGGGGAASEVATRPLEEILAGSIEIGELTPTSAVVRAETAEDVVCSVVFGPTTEYGQQATDLDMAGAGHRSHSAPLRGLQPDTDYHYRLQGTGADGTFYVSKPGTFRTPPGTPGGADPRTNLASTAEGARVVGVSSVFGDSATWAAENAIDGDGATEWSSDGDGDEASLAVELREASLITAVAFWTRTMGSTAQIQTVRVVVDDDTVVGPFELQDASGMHTFELDTSIEGRTLRVEVASSSGGNTGLVEFAAFGE